MTKTVTVQMLGELSLTLEDVRVAERNILSKEWTLIAYLIAGRRRTISRDELLELLVESEEVLDPGNTFRKILWRARKALEPLAKKLDTELIQYRGGICRWNPEVPLKVDVDRFEDLLRRADSCEDPEEQRTLYKQGLALFKGEFLPKLFGEPWRAPLAAWYLSLYEDASLEALPLLLEAGEAEAGEELCRGVLKVAPYNEELYRLRMRCRMAQQDYAGAAEVYRGLHELFQSELDVVPEEETQELYHEVLRHLGEKRKPLEQIQEQLRETSRPDGPRICDFGLFQMFYQMEARSAERRGDAIHIGVLTLEGKRGKELTDRALEKAMLQLKTEIQRTLRIGDVAASCSASQYVLLLVQANYENSQMVCRRVEKAFMSRNPNSPARLLIDVMPLEPLYKI